MVRTTRRSYFGVFTMLAAMALLCVLASSSGAAAGNTSRVSVDSSEAQANGSSVEYGISSGGRYVVFASDASNLVANDTNGVHDLFVRDLQEGTTERVSVSSAGAQANNFSAAGSISANGRYVAISSRASNLVAGDVDVVGYGDIFVRDLQADTTQKVSVSSSGTQAHGDSFSPSISSDGRYVAFTSLADDLVAGDTSGSRDIFVRDMQEGTTERVGLTGIQNQSPEDDFAPSISADGRYVVFKSVVSNLVPGDTNNSTDFFVYDRETGTTERVSVGDSGVQANNSSFGRASISEDGRYVSFASHATNLVAGDTNSRMDIFVHDRVAHTTKRVSMSGCQTQANNDSFSPSISANGRHVVFKSRASNLIAGDTGTFEDIFVRDLQTGTTQKVSVSSSGVQANNDSWSGSISPDGTYVAFATSASNLVANDTNSQMDVFVHEQATSQPSDCIAPSTDASASTDSDPDYTSDTWTTEDVTVTFSALDNVGGSGIKEIRYRAGGAQSIDETVYDPQNPPLINTEGTTTITYFAIDNAGNRESQKTFTVNLDKNAPTSNATAMDSAGNSYTSGTWTSKNVTVELGASDGSGSGVKEIIYFINDGANQAYNPTNKIVVSSEGVSTISYFATDNLDRQETPANTFTVKIDKSAPTLDTITPENRATGVSLGIEPTATFSDEMDNDSLDTSAKLYQWNAKKKKWRAVPVEVGVVGKTATLNPYPADPGKLLAAKKRFKVTVSTGAKNLAGLSMSTSKSWTFTTSG